MSAQVNRDTGVIDEEYVQKANDAGAVLGRRIALNQTEVETSICIVFNAIDLLCPQITNEDYKEDQENIPGNHLEGLCKMQT